MTTKNCFLSLVAMMILSCAAMSQKVAGVWQLDEITLTGPNAKTSKMTQPSMYLFTKSHFSVIYVNSDKPRSREAANTMSAEQLLETFVYGFIANAGTYEVTKDVLTKKNILTMTVTIAKAPNTMAELNKTVYSVTITGNKMTLVSEKNNKGAIPDPTTYTLTRVE